MTLTFAERLARAQLASGGLLCVGLDPNPAKLPRDLGEAGGRPPLLAFNRRIVDATADLAAAYKPQIAFYSALGAEDELLASIRYIRERAPAALVILDAKRNDIGNTAEAYAREAFDRYGADAVTVNPYMGEDSVRPFLARPDRGAVLLCRTSNPGAKDFQDLLIDGLPLYRRVAERAAEHWNEHRNLMLVVGATFPREMADLRLAHPDLPFLVPGIGAQGGDLEATLAAGLDANGAGLLINSARNIIYAGGGTAGAIRAAAADLRTAINRQRAPREALGPQRESVARMRS
jgi:orotidine-5'-phosphate decarboxylase